ncbi:MAG TPA: hypothetical protein VL547_04450 [Dinghuibacter sp.]|uniref:hypothetical protein n=1 Tax=Dinghuibacter sp. TaxID=2024697 RepID=UPI002C95F695|nr:hypothetical protein [Dinghuibacter sp.]HTJ11245.1 hypothetical protein [Dinghuibacter sp.]
MKQITFILAISLFTLSLLPACKKNGGPGNTTPTGDTQGNNFSDSIKNIIPEPIIDSLRSWGMTIYDGQQPPALSGSYLVHIDSCIFDNAGTNMAGRLFDQYQYTFSDENQSNLSIRVATKAIDDPNGATETSIDSTATFVAGTGDYFTIFAEEKGVVTTRYGLSTYTELDVVSGQIVSGGLGNFQYSIYMKDKNDPVGQLIPVNTSRIFVDGDPGGLARYLTPDQVQNLLPADVQTGGLRISNNK